MTVPCVGQTSPAGNQLLSCKVCSLVRLLTVCRNPVKSCRPEYDTLCANDNAGMVDQYVNAHAGTHDLFDLGKPESNSKVGQL